MVPTHYKKNLFMPMNSLLEEFFGDMVPEGTAQNGFRPLLDLKEDDGYLYAQLELPGMKKEEVKISLEDNILTVRGEKKKQDLIEKEEYRRVERSYGVFERELIFPQEIQQDAIRAEMDNGILKISIPKTGKVEPRQIAIN